MTRVEKLSEYSRNACWLYDNRESLRSEFPDKYVLIVGQRVIDSDDDFDRLEARLQAMGSPNADIGALEFINKDPSCMLLCA